MPTDLDRILRDRRLWKEDLQIQFDAALRSVERGYYASARAEINGALMIINSMEKRDGRRDV